VSYASAELYDPASGKWTATGSLNIGRNSHAATLLQNGMVLVAGGYATTGATSSAELYDPATGTWTLTGSLVTARSQHSATLLPNGQVLAVSGLKDSPSPLTSTELYNPAIGTWSNTGSLNQGRRLHTATLLPDGSVLAAGGQTSGVFATETAELYGSPSDLPANVDGRGTLDNQGNEVTFGFRVTQSNDDILGDFRFCDHTEGFCKKVGRVQSLTITDNTAEFSGIFLKDDGFVAFDVSVTDNGGRGRSDTISISLSDGYSVSGTLLSGNIRIY
jgi:hypothetical protein